MSVCCRHSGNAIWIKRGLKRYPQGELKVSRISEAISGANGEYSHQLLAPADNISIAKNELAVLGTISWT